MTTTPTPAPAPAPTPTPAPIPGTQSEEEVTQEETFVDTSDEVTETETVIEVEVPEIETESEPVPEAPKPEPIPEPIDEPEEEEEERAEPEPEPEPVDPLQGLIVTQYEIGEYSSGSQNVEVTYRDDQGNLYKRTVNIPKTPVGEIDEDYFQTVLYEQLIGVNHKKAVGMAVFKDPNEPEEAEVTDETSE